MTTTSAAFFWGMFGAALMTMFGITPQSVMCATMGAALYMLVFQESPGSDMKARAKVLIVAFVSILCSAIAAGALGEYFEKKQIITNGFALAFSVSGPWVWKNIPDLFSQAFNKWFPK